MQNNNLFDSPVAQTTASHADGRRVEPPKIFNLDFNGRYGRLNYVRAYCLVGLASFLAMAVSVLLGPVGSLLAFAFGLFIIVLNVRAGILRLHDMNKSGWLMLLLLVPLVNFIFLLVLLFAPGTQGNNKYGTQTVPSSAVCAVVLVIRVVMRIGMRSYMMSQKEPYMMQGYY